MGTKQDWETYEKILVKFDYTPEQIEAVKEIRESYDHCTFEMFTGLIKQGLIERVAKVKKPRNYFVNEAGEFLFLNHYHKGYQIAARFKNEL